METCEITVVKSPLQESELQYLDDILLSGDRAGYYLAYYNISYALTAGDVDAGSSYLYGYQGSDQALEQAQVTSFSNGLGGIAWLQNYFIKMGMNQWGRSNLKLFADQIFPPPR